MTTSSGSTKGVDNTVNTGDWVYPDVNADFGSVTVDGNQTITVGDSGVD
jgi:hypothetical protein